MHSPYPVRHVLGSLLLATCGIAQVNWNQIAAAGAPMAYGGSAWDTVRNRLVAYGGEVAGTPTNTTWEWNGSAWQNLNPAVRPSSRRRPAMAFDEARGVTVLFGGGAGIGFFDETWTWNGTTWTQVLGSMPPPRFGAAMAYDSLRQVVVMFGGFVPSGQDIADVWEWNGTSWTPRVSVGGPSARGAHRMAFDAARGQTVLCGGYSTPQLSTLSDTWTWDGTSWTQRPGGPGSLCDEVLAYDSARQRVVLFGGLRIQSSVLTDLGLTWDWNGTTWSQRATVTSPTFRSATANAFDPVAHRILLAGGATATGAQFADTWMMAPTTPASVTNYGSGCPSSAGTVELNSLSLPYAGSTFVHEIANAPASAVIGLVVFGLSNTIWSGIPLPFHLAPIGAPGCFVLASVDVTPLILLVNGTGTVSWSIPNQPTLVGVSFFTQALVIDPLSPLAFQIGLSSGRQAVIGAL